MKAREAILCIHGSAKQSVPGDGGGSSTRVIQPRQGMGKRPISITSTGYKLITIVILFKSTNLHSFAAG
jgi:hypothetical protein